MSERLREILALLDERSSRERFMICFVLLATVFVIWNSLLMRPLKQAEQLTRTEIETRSNTLSRLEKETGSLEAKLKLDPNELNRTTKASLEQEIWKLDEQIVEQTADLVPPEEMARALRRLLRDKRELELVRMESLPPEPLYGRSEAVDASDADSQVYLHTVELELIGGYLGALRYVKEIEAMPWNLLWDTLEYDVQEYPRGRITLRVQSLSTQEGWLGA